MDPNPPPYPSNLHNRSRIIEDPYSNEEIKLLIKKEVEKYFDLQSRDVMRTFRRFSQNDPEINSILNESSSKISKEADEEYLDFHNKISKETDQFIRKAQNEMDKTLNKRISSIITKEPYDVISKEFLSNLEKKYKSEINDLDDKIHGVLIFAGIIAMAVGFLIYKLIL